MRERGLDGWETLAAGLGAGLLAHAAPAAAAALLLTGFLALFGADRIDMYNGRRLLALTGVAVAALLWGATGAIAATLVWRVAAEVAAHTDGVLRVHFVATPLAAVAWRLDAPDLMIAGLGCIALVAWLDWLVRVLADWRLDAKTEGRIGAFVGAQAATLAPLLIFPTPTSCLVAFAAMGLARAITWKASAGYAVAR